MLDPSHWGWPQFAYLALTFIGLGAGLAQHGKPRDPHSFWTTLFATMLVLALLFYGGFFA